MAEYMHARLEQLCKEINECCDTLDAERCLSMEMRSSEIAIKRWAMAENGLLDKVAIAASICAQHGLPEADRLRDIVFRLSDYTVGVLWSSGSIGDLRGLCWAVKDLGHILCGLPGKITTYQTTELCGELDITSATLTRYARLAGVRPTRTGERDRRYTAEERMGILRAIANGASDSAMVAKARKLLDEIESKSKARN